MLYEDVPDTLSQLIRTAFVPKEGCKFIVADFSAIEARVLAWFAGEVWRQEVFANGGDIYCASASQMFKVPVEKHGVNGHPRSKWWLCDGMCDDCEYHAPGDILSLDMPTSSDDGDEVTLLDMLEDPAPSIEEVICDKAELDQLYERLNQLMPEAVEIGRLRQKGLTDEAIAKIVGIKRTTFRSRLEKAKAQLAAEYPDRF